MKTKTRTNKGYNYPASALLKEFPDDAWASTIGERLGVGRAAIQTWREGNTYLDQWRADKYACLLGKHPSEIWSNWFDEVELAS
jgi:hypothetical protein